MDRPHMIVDGVPVALSEAQLAAMRQSATPPRPVVAAAEALTAEQQRAMLDLMVEAGATTAAKRDAVLARRGLRKP